MYNKFSYPLKRTPYNSALLKTVEQVANKLYYEPINALSYNHLELFDSVGSRVEYEKEYMTHRKMLCAFSVMAFLNEDEKWLLKLYDILWAICDEFTWALPAHFHAKEDAESLVTLIDLFAAETAFAISEIYHIIEDIMPQRLKSRIRYEIKRRIVTPYLSKELRWGPSNWSGVCSSGVIASMIYLGFDLEFSEAKSRLLTNIDDFLQSFTDDGCCLEGTLYWNYGFSHFCAAAELIRQYTDEKIKYFKDEKVKKIAHFGQNMYLRENYIVSFSDSPHTDKYNCGLYSLLSEKYDGIAAPDLKYQSVFGDDVRYRFINLIRNLYWANENLKQTENNNVVFYDKAAWYLNKQNSYCFAAKGGHNEEPHNHNDIGSFLVFDDNKYIIDDPGWPQYDKKYFSEERYENICASSLGHSVPIICDTAQKDGIDHYSEILKADDTTFELEFSKAYTCDNLSSLKRKFTLSNKELLIEDTFIGNCVNIKERFISQLEPKIINDKVIIENYEFTCSLPAKIELSSFSFIPRFSGLDGNEDFKDIRYIIDFKIENGENVIFKLKKLT